MSLVLSGLPGEPASLSHLLKLGEGYPSVLSMVNALQKGVDRVLVGPWVFESVDWGPSGSPVCGGGALSIAWPKYTRNPFHSSAFFAYGATQSLTCAPFHPVSVKIVCQVKLCVSLPGYVPSTSTGIAAKVFLNM